MKDEQQKIVDFFLRNGIFSLCSFDAPINLDGDVYCLTQGEVMFYYNDMVTGSVVAPCVIGLAVFFYPCDMNIQIAPIGECILHKCSKEDFKLAMRSIDIANGAATILAQYNSQLIKSNNIFKVKNAYKVVRKALLYYFRNQSSLKDHYSISQFLIKFTGVSRSRVMLILKELRYAGVISHENPPVLLKKIPNDF